MAFTTVATAKGTGSTSASPINSTTAKLIVIEAACIGDQAPAGTIGGAADGNTWTPGSAQNDVTSSVRSRMWYCINPNVGANHVFGLTPGQFYASMIVRAFDCTGTPSFHSETGAFLGASPGASISTGNISPPVGALVIAGHAVESATAGTVTPPGSPFGAVDSIAAASGVLGVRMDQAVAGGAIGATYSYTSAYGSAASIMAFTEPAAGPVITGPLSGRLTRSILTGGRLVA